ncbi:MAG TPA: prolipoprotein diacylglyceryl transferase family protein [Candidatus Limnocylindrales bacterium]|nr:prolipoprotein diacylglyceryl transferase family protein [Candidatus Limnocylindrales bacterium]
MPATVAPAVIAVSFDPVLAVDGFAVRWETVGIAAAVVVALLVAARVVVRTPILGGGGRLRRDDLLFVAVGATAGAVAGGRVGYVLLWFEYYRANPNAILDPASGGFELSLGLVGGVFAGLAVAALLEGGVRRWAHAAPVPIVLGLALGKAALALGGTGQGAPADVSWATAYTGPGPWGSLAPTVPSHPAQLYEAAAYVLAIVVLLVAAGMEPLRRRDGRLLSVALVLVAIVRFAVAFTWRDPAVAGPFRVEQALAFVPFVVGLVSWLLAARAAARNPYGTAPGPEAAAWPEPGIADRWRRTPGGR